MKLYCQSAKVLSMPLVVESDAASFSLANYTVLMSELNTLKSDLESLLLVSFNLKNKTIICYLINQLAKSCYVH